MCLAPSFLPSQGGAVTRIYESKRRRYVVEFIHTAHPTRVVAPVTPDSARGHMFIYRSTSGDIRYSQIRDVLIKKLHGGSPNPEPCTSDVPTEVRAVPYAYVPRVP